MGCLGNVVVTGCESATIAEEPPAKESKSRFRIGSAADALLPQPVFARLRRIAERQDCAFEIIHHVNRSGTYRGSSALKGAADSMLLLKSRPDSSLITFKTEKTRDTAGKEFCAMAQFGDGTFRLGGADVAAESRQIYRSDRLVLDALEQNGPATIRSIIGKLERCSPETARRAVYRLARMGLIRRTDSGGSGMEATYAKA